MSKKEARIIVYHQVTSSGVSGSNHILTATFDKDHKVSIAVDAGLFMGGGELEESSKLNLLPLTYRPEKLLAIFITHAHSDHEGMLPFLVRAGYNQPIYMSKGTATFLPIALEDCCKCLNHDGQPIYSQDDVSTTLSLVKPVEEGVTFAVYNDSEGNNINATFFGNGHLPGASSILLQFNGRGKRSVNIFLTGDIKMHHPLFDVKPFPEWLKLMRISNLVIESTYGSTSREKILDTFEENVSDCSRRGGTILCPALSLDRTEIVLYKLRQMQEKRRLNKKIPIYLVGKLAIKYLNVYDNNPNLNLTVKDFKPYSFSISSLAEVENKIEEGEQFIVLAAPGMGQLGASLELEEKLCDNNNNLIQYTSYVPENGIASEFIKAERYSTIALRNGQKVTINARIEQTLEFSQHAKCDELMDILERFPNKYSVTINHGSPETKGIFKNYIMNNGVTTSREYEENGVVIINRETCLRVTPLGIDKVLNSKILPGKYELKKAQEKYNKNKRKGKDKGKFKNKRKKRKSKDR